VSLPCLRDGLPPPYPFSVDERACVAKLDQNEAPTDLPEEVKRAVTERVSSRAWNRYPQPRQYVEARAVVAAHLNVEPEQVLVTVGGDQTILSAFHLAGGPERTARWFEPTYPYVGLAARLTHTAGQPVSLGAGLDDQLTAEVAGAPGADLVVLVSPNNPTGGLCSPAVVEAAGADEQRLVFVDEAYADFSGHSFVFDVGRRDNLLVGRSLSKGLVAALRVGLCVGHPAMIGALERVFTAPYHLNALQLAVAAEFDRIVPAIAATAAAVVAERQRVFAALVALDGVEPLPSAGNFVLFRVAGAPERATEVNEALAGAGVRIRDVGRVPGLAGYLRVTIGTVADNDLFLLRLSAAL